MQGKKEQKKKFVSNSLGKDTFLIKSSFLTSGKVSLKGVWCVSHQLGSCLVCYKLFFSLRSLWGVS